MKTFYIGSTIALSLMVIGLVITTLVIRPPLYSNAMLLCAFTIPVPVGIMGYLAMKLGSKEAKLKGAKEGSSNGKD